MWRNRDAGGIRTVYANNGKNDEAVVIKYLVQRTKTLKNSNKKLYERLKNCMCFQSVHKNILKNDEKVVFYTGIP